MLFRSNFRYKDALEIFRLMNAIWYSQLIHRLDLCIGNCQAYIPYGCHIRGSECPARTPYEESILVDNNSKMREMHLESKRAPIPDRATSDSALDSDETPGIAV